MDKVQKKDHKKEKENENWQEKYAEMEDKYKRALADYQNLLKRTAVEKQEFAQYANERLIHNILPVYDNLRISFAHAEKEADSNAWLEGIKYIIKQFGDVLAELGVSQIEAVGKQFDPHLMEAVEKKHTDEKKSDGLVEKEVMSGYKLHDRVIRAARVVVWEYVENSHQ